MATLLDLQKRMNKKADKVADLGNEAKKHAARVVVNYLIDITPVDTSKALSNWQAFNAFPAVFPLPAYVAGKAGSTRGASAGKAKAEAADIIAQAKPGEPIYLSNVLPYIRRLDGGSSTQHPGGFVNASVIVGKKALNTFKFDWK